MGLQVVSSSEDLRAAVRQARGAGQTVGLVPTMGALHAGHTSLIDTARAETGFVVVSLFVNPTQFGPHEDFDRYPRTFEQDRRCCEEHGVDLLFAPEGSLMYPEGFQTFVEVSELQKVLEGAHRPGHFRGVATVVLQLFHLVGPDLAYFGQKDAQQVCIIQQMVRDLHVPVAIRVCPTVREADGLALSSRNQYLDPHQRQQATVLHQALQEAQQRIEQGEKDGEAIRRGMEARIAATPGASLDYAAVVDAETLMAGPLSGKILLAVAVRFGNTRLIDNCLLEITR
jgi:pantoate--beta-alanine ligase